jgi:hypothetical protein
MPEPKEQPSTAAAQLGLQPESLRRAQCVQAWELLAVASHSRESELQTLRQEEIDDSH